MRKTWAQICKPHRSTTPWFAGTDPTCIWIKEAADSRSGAQDIRVRGGYVQRGRQLARERNLIGLVAWSCKK